MAKKKRKQQPFALQQMIRDATTAPYKFVCSPQEFRMRFGLITENDYEEARKYIVLCKDGMIRPR